MCTVTAHKTNTGWLVTMNRDELRTRPSAYPPKIWENADLLAPVDAEAGGTWIGVRRDGIWACLLNGYMAHTPASPSTPQTRGRLIPAILSNPSPQSALENIDLSQTNSFRLWVGHNDGITEYFWNLETLERKDFSGESWYFASSSSLKQSEVIAHRRQLFENWQQAGAPTAGNSIPLFHIEVTDGNKEWAVNMSRDYSHTKSITQISADGTNISMRHWDAPRFDEDAASQTSF